LNRIIFPISIKNGNNQHPAYARVHTTRIKQMITYECSSKIDKNYKTIKRIIQKRRLYLLNDAK